MKIKCQIKWIGADGKPTPDTNDAVMMAHYHKAIWSLPVGGIGNKIVARSEEIENSFPLCAVHYATVTNELRYPVGAWSFTNLNSEDK